MKVQFFVLLFLFSFSIRSAFGQEYIFEYKDFFDLMEQIERLHTTLSDAIPDARTSRARGSTRRLGYDRHASMQYKLLTICLEGARSIYIRQGQGKTDMALPSIMVSIKNLILKSR